MNFDELRESQEKLYSKPWQNAIWSDERLYPVMIPLRDVIAGATARLNFPYRPECFNVLGTPRSGTKWMVNIVEKLLDADPYWRLKKILKSLTTQKTRVLHLHEGIINDLKKNQKLIFIYRDVRDSIVSGYFYIRNGLHGGTMRCTTDAFRHLSKEDALERQIKMYMMYRMPVISYWFDVDDDRVCKVRYEDMVAEPINQIEKITNQFGLRITSSRIKKIANEVSFLNMTGRKSGTENPFSHQRKGEPGDWKNHFTKRHIQLFNQMGGKEFLQHLGYKV